MKIYSLGLFVFVGVLTSSFIIWRRLSDLGYKEEKVIDMILGMGIFAFLLGRLIYVLINWEQFGMWTKIIDLGKYPGFSLWGVILGCFWGLRWFTKKEKWDFWQVADEVTFGLLPMLVLLLVGCFFDGCILGRPTSMPWGIFFAGSMLRRQPVALFLALGLIAVWYLLLRIERRWRLWNWYRSKQEGFIFLSGLMLSSLFGFLLAFLSESKLYLQMFEVGGLFVGVVVSFVVLFKRSGIKIKKIR